MLHTRCVSNCSLGLCSPCPQNTASTATPALAGPSRPDFSLPPTAAPPGTPLSLNDLFNSQAAGWARRGPTSCEGSDRTRPRRRPGPPRAVRGQQPQRRRPEAEPYAATAASRLACAGRALRARPGPADGTGRDGTGREEGRPQPPHPSSPNRLLRMRRPPPAATGHPPRQLADSAFARLRRIRLPPPSPSPPSLPPPCPLPLLSPFPLPPSPPCACAPPPIPSPTPTPARAFSP